MDYFAKVSILLLLIKQLCRGVVINETSFCPLYKAAWEEKNADFKCMNGEKYFCSPDETNDFVNGCLPPHPIPANSTGCPFVVKATKGVVHEAKYTPCNVTLLGCPPTVHQEYTISQLYKYPLCLMLPNERNRSIPDPGEYTTDHTTVTSGSTTTYIGDGEGISTGGVLGIVAAALVLIVIVVLVVIWRKRIIAKCRRDINQGFIGNDNEHNIGTNQNISNSTPLVNPTFDISSCDADEKDQDIDERENLLPVQNTDEQQSLDNVDEDEYREDSSQSNSTSLSSGSDDPPILEEEDKIMENHDQSIEGTHLNNGSHFLEKCHEYANDGVEEGLKEIFEDELGKLKQGCNPRITTGDLKKVIALWVKRHDKPDLLTSAVELLSVLDDNCCLENLELIPDNYETPIALLLYSGRMEKERITEYLLKRLRHIDDEDKEQKTILHYCVYMDSKDLAWKVIEKDRSLLDKRNIDGRSAFNLAIYLRKPIIAEFLLEKDANIEDENFKIETVLEKCLSHKWINLLEKLLYNIKRKNLELPDLGKTLRIFLSLCNKTNLYFIEVALEVFPDMLSNVGYYSGDHPFIWALKVKKKDVSQFILSRMSIDELYSAEECKGLSALHVAIKSGSLVRKILKQDKDHLLLNKIDRQNNTPIMYAAQCKSHFYFKILLKKQGLSVTNTNIDGKNILHILVENNWYDKCEEILRGRDSKENKRISEGNKTTLLKGQDKYGMTPLMYAVSNFCGIEMIQLLVDEGSELLQMDKGRKTVFHHLVDIYSEKNVATWTECARVLMRSEKYRKTNYFFKVKDSSGQSLSEIALNKGCLHLLKTVDAEEVTEQSR